VLEVKVINNSTVEVEYIVKLFIFWIVLRDRNLKWDQLRYWSEAAVNKACGPDIIQEHLRYTLGKIFYCYLLCVSQDF